MKQVKQWRFSGSGHRLLITVHGEGLIYTGVECSQAGPIFLLLTVKLTCGCLNGLKLVVQFSSHNQKSSHLEARAHPGEIGGDLPSFGQAEWARQ